MENKDTLIKRVVAYASAGSYDPDMLLENGYEITVNVDITNKRFLTVGDQKIIPDVIIWHPEGLRSLRKGKAITVEIVETNPDLLQVDRLVSLSKLNIRTNLLIPNTPEFKVRVRAIFVAENIKNITIQTFTYDSSVHSYIFTTI